MSGVAFKRFFSLQSAQIKWNIQHSALRRKRMEEKRKKEEAEYVACVMRTIKHVHGYDATLYPYTMISKNL